MPIMHGGWLRIRTAASALAVLATVAAGGCSELGFDQAPDSYEEAAVEDLYNVALDAMQAGQYVAAEGYFDEVERQHPYSVWAIKAQLMSAFSLYQRSHYDDAVVALDRFISLHPGNRDVAYAYYLKALSYYEQITDVSRDQRITELALDGLREVVDRFPDSEYARDAALKIDLALDHLAGKEMDVGRYYLRQGHYTAAINRFRDVIENYQTTTHTPEALYRMSEAYTAMGLDEEAQRIAALLGYNYPGSVWYIDGYELVEGVDIQGNEDSQKEWLDLSWLNGIF